MHTLLQNALSDTVAVLCHGERGPGCAYLLPVPVPTTVASMSCPHEPARSCPASSARLHWYSQASDSAAAIAAAKVALHFCLGVLLHRQTSCCDCCLMRTRITSNLEFSPRRLPVSPALQAHMAQLPAPMSDYVTDTRSVLDQSLRILQAMTDVAADAGWLATALSTMQLVQSLMQVSLVCSMQGSNLPKKTKCFCFEGPAVVGPTTPSGC